MWTKPLFVYYRTNYPQIDCRIIKVYLSNYNHYNIQFGMCNFFFTKILCIFAVKSNYLSQYLPSTYGCYNVMELWIPTKLLVVTCIPQVILHPNENRPQIHWIRGSFYYPFELWNSETWNCTDTGLLSKLHLVLNRALKPRKETLIIGVFILQFAELCAFWNTAQVNRDINLVLTVFHRNYASKIFYVKTF